LTRTMSFHYNHAVRVAHKEGQPVTTEDNRAWIRRYFLDEVWNKGNVALVPKLFAPDCRVHDPTIAGISGPDGVIRFVTMCRAAFPDLQLTIEDQIADGNKVATRFTLRGTQTGRFLDIAPTGKQVTVTGMNIAHVLHGRIVESWLLRDDLGLLHQLGVVPQMEGVRTPQG
jgi:steroid delta-isomerase-like uncharacterized protein